MNTGGEAAEQIVRMSLQGFEVAAKISGVGVKNIAIMIYAILKEEKKTKGKARLTSMLKSGKELKVYTVKKSDLKKFTQEAKKYGVLYCVLADSKNQDPHAEVDVIARAEDASKISRIVERFNLASVDTASIVSEVEKSKDKKADISEPQIDTPKKEEKAAFLDAVMGKPTKKEEPAPNPLSTKTEKSPLSELFSEMPSKHAEGVIMTDKKPSVKGIMREIENNRKQSKEDTKSLAPKKNLSSNKKNKANQMTKHQQPKQRKKTRYRKNRGR